MLTRPALYACVFMVLLACSSCTTIYRYDAAGNLAEVQDRNGAISRMRYNSDHFLLDYTDPRGRIIARYEYDAAGRVINQYDAASQPAWNPVRIGD